jgi:hypothetical protein
MKTYSTNQDLEYKNGMINHLKNTTDKPSIANNFAKYSRRQEVTRFIARYEMFRMIQNVQGVILECGVYSGQGLFSWAQFSSILEPVGGAFRKIYGFDTFEGFPSIHEKDLVGNHNLDWKPGDLKCNSYDELLGAINLFDKNRFLPQFEKIELYKGDFIATSEIFLKENPHCLVSLLYLDFDIYEPTRKALELFLPRMPKGAILAFDEINHPLWPGETLALLESLDINNYEIKKFPFEINMSYIVL